MSKRSDRRRELKEKRRKQKIARYKDDFQEIKIPKLIDPNPEDHQGSVMWSFLIFDKFPDWAGENPDCFCEVSDFIKKFEERTWAEIALDRKRNHPIEIGSLGKEAQGRLRELQYDDLDELWSLHFKGTWRLWGKREGRLFRVLWWDPNHRVYPIDLQDREKNSAG